MAGFGGAVKLTGESEYRRALQQITQNLKEVSSELNAVSSAYASNDRSIDALTARQNVLNQRLTEQTNKLNVLKAQYQAMSSEYADQSAKHTALVNSYNQEKAKLEEIGRTLGTTSKEYQEQKAKVDGLTQEVIKSTQAQDANEKSMSKMRIEINNAQADCNRTAREIDNLGKEIEGTGKEAQQASDGFTVFKGVLANLATQAITMAISALKKLGDSLVNVGKQAIAGYGEMEQLVGGVEKIFGEDTAQTVIDNANRAFASAGLSANQYMQTVTGFSSALIQSLNGDTAESAKVADRAIKDMADNANTFGTSMESIQSAYQGFAKQNYTMLDNLKLGYGGTKTEMERLIADASKMTDVQRELGVAVKEGDMSFANIANAISVVQKNLGIMGTTQKEAEKTIQGSTASMKSAWQNMLVGMADENANFEELATNFVNTLISEDGTGGVLGNIIPRISQVVQGISSALQNTLPMLLQNVMPLVNDFITTLIPEIISTIAGLLPQMMAMGIRMVLSVIEGISEAVPLLLEQIPEIMSDIIEVFTDWFPDVIDTGIDLLLALVDGIMKAIPKMIAELPRIITSIIDTLLGLIPKIINAGVKLLVALVQNMPAIINGIVSALPTLISGLIDGLMYNLPAIINAGVQLLVALVQNLPAIIAGVVKAVPQIINALVTGFTQGVSQMASVGLNLVKGIWNGISDATGWILGKIRSFGQSVLNGLKSFFGIHSPSTVFRDEIGENLALGIGEGFLDEMNVVSKEMQRSIPTHFDTRTKFGGVTGAKYETGQDMVSAFKQALSEMKIVLDDEVAGHFVERTVTRIIYT